MENVYSYADVLESYMIAEEGLFSKLKNKFKKKNDKKIEESKTANSYNFHVNTDKALEDSKLNLTPYPVDKWNTKDDVIDAMEKDIKIALPKILSCQEVMNAVKDLCEEYNDMPSGDEREDRFNIEDAPTKLSPNWFKSQFKLTEDGGYWIICEGDQMFRSFYGISIINILKKYLNDKYSNYRRYFSLDTGDGDEGCLYYED